MSIADQAREQTALDELQRANRQLHAKIARLQRSKDELYDAVYRAARDALNLIPPPVTPKLSRARGGKPEVALLHLTDWQLGKQTATYNTDICVRRIARAVNTAIDITELQRKDHAVDQCVIMLGGDMVEGVSIFPSQAFEVDSTAYTQFFSVVELIEQTIVTALANFKTVTVFHEHGNHGRIGRKGELPGQDNLDLIAYEVARRRLLDHAKIRGRLSWQANADWYTMVDVGNYHALLVHGDEIRSASAHPVYAITNHVHRWQTGSLPNREQFTDCYQGHRHRSESYVLANGSYIYLTGSPESGNTFASQHLSAQGRPSQRLHFVSPERGRVTGEYVLWLDD